MKSWRDRSMPRSVFFDPLIKRLVPALIAGALIPLLAASACAARPKFKTSSPDPVMDSSVRGSNGPPTGTGGVTVIPKGEYQNEPIGLRHSTLFRNTQFPSGNPITLPTIEPSTRTESVKTRIIFDLPTVTAGLPFIQRGFEPQDADLKIGPFFFKVRSLQGAVLHSDNINLTPDDERESGTIAITTLSLSVVAQLTEGLHLATSGSLVFLPLEGEGGIAGFALTDLYAFGVLAGPSTRAQIAWETQIGGWNVVFSDEFRISLGTYSDNVRNDYELFEGSRFDGESRAGRYSFSSGNGSRGGGGNRRDQTDFRTDFVVFSNTVSAETHRLLPGSIRLQARIYREDLWYNQGNRGLPSLREGGFIKLASERDNTRFKPFISYEAFRSDRNDAFQNIFRAGIDGPITNQIHLHAEGGYYFGREDDSGYLWNVSLNHVVGPYTQQSLIYARTFDSFHEEISQGVGYNLRQILGPKLSADAYVYDLTVEDSTGSDFERNSREEFRAGVRLTLTAGPKTTVRLSGNYSLIDPDHTETWTGRFDIGYNFTDTLLAHFLYQYQQSTSRDENENYRENLMFLSVTKYFY